MLKFIDGIVVTILSIAIDVFLSLKLGLHNQFGRNVFHF